MYIETSKSKIHYSRKIDPKITIGISQRKKKRTPTKMGNNQPKTNQEEKYHCIPNDNPIHEPIYKRNTEHKLELIQIELKMLILYNE